MLIVVVPHGLVGLDAYRAFGLPWVAGNLAFGVAVLTRRAARHVVCILRVQPSRPARSRVRLESERADANMRSTVRVATYNIHKCRGLDGRVRPLRIAEVLREVRADVIGLQEVVSLEGGRPEQDQARFLAEALGLEMRFGAVRSLRGGRYGNLVLSALPLGLGCSYDLTVAGREERGCLRADVRLSEQASLHVFNVHLGTSFHERRQQGPRLLEAVLRESDDLTGPRVVLGDFNEWTVGLASRLLASHFRAVDLRGHLRRARTYPGILPFMHLDHIYYDGGLELKALALHRTRLALMASDHVPLVADFEVTAFQGAAALALQS